MNFNVQIFYSGERFATFFWQLEHIQNTLWDKATFRTFKLLSKNPSFCSFYHMAMWNLLITFYEKVNGTTHVQKQIVMDGSGVRLWPMFWIIIWLVIGVIVILKKTNWLRYCSCHWSSKLWYSIYCYISGLSNIISISILEEFCFNLLFLARKDKQQDKLLF